MARMHDLLIIARDVPGLVPAVWEFATYLQADMPADEREMSSGLYAEIADIYAGGAL